MKRYLFYFFLFFTYHLPIHALKLDRVILASDLHREYIDFWPLVAKAWRDIVGVKPTLALIAPNDIYIDESLGDVIRFEPIPGIPTHMQAQVIRLLLPALFPDDGCIISDMDMIPCQKDYFIESIKSIANDCFVVYRDRAYAPSFDHYPMCYNAAKGKVFGQLFNVRTIEDIKMRIIEWHGKKLGWNTDELMLVNTLNAWPEAAQKCIRLGSSVSGRIDRGNWIYDRSLVAKHAYIDAHLPKPYRHHYAKIDALAQNLGIEHDYKSAQSIPVVRAQKSCQDCSYVIPLMIVMNNTQGPILEMGTHDYGTPLLHELARFEDRFLGTAETDLARLSFFSHELTDSHAIWLIMNPNERQEDYPTLDKWDNVYASRHWSIIILNHKPHERRAADVQLMRDHAQIFIIPNPDESCLELAKTFKYAYCYDRYEKSVLLLSSMHDINKWFEDV